MQLLPGGDILATGAFTTTGGTTIAGLGRWNGTTWMQVATPVTSGVSNAIIMPNGDFIASGGYTYVGSPLNHGVIRWDGTQWSQLGLGVTLNATGSPGAGGNVYKMALLPNGTLIVAGDFSYAGGAPAKNIAAWDGSSWSPLGAGLDGAVTSLLALPNGDLLAGGGFTHSGTISTPRLARWNGSVWSDVHGGFPASSVVSMVPFQGDVVIGLYAGSALYRLTTRPACPADFDCSGAAEVPDIFAFLNSWFGGSPAADANFSGSLTVQDIFDYLGAWFAGC
jgi:hypothetical protein